MEADAEAGESLWLQGQPRPHSETLSQKNKNKYEKNPLFIFMWYLSMCVWCVCLVYVCVYVCVWLFLCVDTRDGVQVSFSISLAFGTGSYHSTWSALLCVTWLYSEPPRSVCLCGPVSGVTGVSHTSVCLHGHLNSGPHASAASTLCTESSPIPLNIRWNE